MNRVFVHLVSTGFELTLISLFYTFSQNSQILNEARLKVLQARQSYVNKVLDEALEHLFKTTKDEEMYKKVLQKLVEQVNCDF